MQYTNDALAKVSKGDCDAQPTIQMALDKGGVVRIPQGVYRIGGRGLRIGSRTRLVAHPEARIYLADGAGVDESVFLLANADPERGDSDIEIDGGIWDGNNPNNHRTQAARKDPLADPGTYTGVMVKFFNVKRLTFRSARMCDSESYHFRACRIEDFLVERILFHSTSPQGNNDGIHLGGFCERGVIRHIRGVGQNAPSDDLVALNADDSVERIEGRGKVNGPIRDVCIYDLKAEHCYSFVRILSTVSPIERITIDDVSGGCEHAALNMDGARGCRVPVFDASDPAHADGVGVCEDIRMSNVRVHRAAKKSGALLRLAQHAKRLTITGFVRDFEKDQSPDMPTMKVEHLPFHWLTIDDDPPQLLQRGDVVSGNEGSIDRLELTRAEGAYWGGRRPKE